MLGYHCPCKTSFCSLFPRLHLVNAIRVPLVGSARLTDLIRHSKPMQWRVRSHPGCTIYGILCFALARGPLVWLQGAGMCREQSAVHRPLTS